MSNTCVFVFEKNKNKIKVHLLKLVEYYLN